MTRRFARPASAFAFLCLLFLSSCNRESRIHSSLQAAIQPGNLSILKYPNFSDYRELVQSFYQQRDYAPVWIESGRPTQQAEVMIGAFKNSDQQGLDPDEYDSSLWPERIRKLGGSAKFDAQFDLALTVSAMRYISDLHIGRVNPRHFNFGINIDAKKYDLPQFLATRIVSANDAGSALAQIEPQSAEYKRTEHVLQQYLRIAGATAWPSLPAVQNPVPPAHEYPAAQQLAERLQLLGDLPAGVAPANTSNYSPQLAEGVKNFQLRHDLPNDGRLTPQTIAALNVPLEKRVHQLEDALERWRWLENQYQDAPIFVNIPEFALRVYGAAHKLQFMEAVVVGEAVEDKKTPLITHEMTYIVFRPFWNVPSDIVRKEIVPKMEHNRDYLTEHNFELTGQNGKPVAHWSIADLDQGRLMVREKPGPKNSLGLVKFMFPNEFDIYLHGTPANQLFNHTQRAFSHGCIRLADPEKLADWLLKDQPEWTPDKIHDAMYNGADNRTVDLKAPVPVVIFYNTAFVEEDGKVYFFDDIYGYDQQLEAVLAKGPPYPQAPTQPLQPRSKDTS